MCVVVVAAASDGGCAWTVGLLARLLVLPLELEGQNTFLTLLQSLERGETWLGDGVAWCGSGGHAGCQHV